MSDLQEPWTLIDEDHLPGGSGLALYEREGAFMIRSNGLELMTSEAVWSEEAFVGFGLEALGRDAARVLIGGLGLGFTLGEVCRRLPAAQISVVEISKAVIGWLKGPARACNGHWLDQSNVALESSDITDFLNETDETYDLILLDVDNGPEALVHPSNDRLYAAAGLQNLSSRLTSGGVAVFWSAIEASEFERRLSGSFEKVAVERYAIPGQPNVEHFYFVVTNR